MLCDHDQARHTFVQSLRVIRLSQQYLSSKAMVSGGSVATESLKQVIFSSMDTYIKFTFFTEEGGTHIARYTYSQVFRLELYV